MDTRARRCTDEYKDAPVNGVSRKKEEHIAENFVLGGNICYSQNSRALIYVEQGYLICTNDTSAGVYKELPQMYAGFPLTDYGDRLIVSDLTDLHPHAPQYSFRGLGIDLELSEWLDTRTFPEESRYSDMKHARRAYTMFTESMKHSTTTKACIFATIHKKATELLMDLMEETGLKTMINKVNMDRSSPDILAEETGESLRETRQRLADIKGQYRNTVPILTPRFIPTCTDTLMEESKKLQMEYELPVRPHLSEDKGEIDWVKELCLWSEFYGDAYDHFGMFSSGVKTIVAHCMWPPEKEIQRMKGNDVYVAHYPQSNTSLSSGIAPVRIYLEQGTHTGLGADVAGGAGEPVFRAMTDAIQVSKLRWRLVDETLKPLTAEEAFYLGTKGDDEFFGEADSFEEGYELDALVLNDESLKHPQPLSLKERLERFIYISGERHIDAKYVADSKVFQLKTEQV